MSEIKKHADLFSNLKLLPPHYVIKNAPSCIKVMKVESPSTTLSFKKSYKIFHDYKHHNSNHNDALHRLIRFDKIVS